MAMDGWIRLCRRSRRRLIEPFAPTIKAVLETGAQQPALFPVIN